MTTTKQYDFLNRLLAISSVGSTGVPPVAVDGSSAASFTYQYNDANQRTRVTHADGSYWLYEYDPLGQLISGKHYWSDGTPVTGQQHEYAYDDIGNRTSTKAGGDAVGAGLRPASYSANNLNQYTQRDVPGAADIIGIAHANAAVTNNGQAVYRRGEYFWKELSINNASAAVWQGVTNIASLSGTNQTNIGNFFLAKTNETFAYDLDGNTTNDGRFAYTWDAENRLTKAESHSAAPTASKRKVIYEYDGQGRMVRRTEYDGSSGSYVLTNDLKFVRDGWACLADLDAQNASTLARSYLWGLDLSSSLTGAGGVGGLLALNGAGNGVHFCAVDGNGNVVALVKGSDGTASASYEYDPFGKATRTTGAMAKENPFRFSTKRADDCTDLTSYEYRTHSPSIGRWLNRDPIEESGGLNLHAFNQNVPNLRFDRYGLDSEPTPPDCAPCSWLGWKHEPVPEGDERDLGWAEFHEDPPPGFHEPITCTACRCKPGKEWTLNSARCTARIWLDPKIEPNTVVHRFTAWWHESRHIKNSVDGFKKKDAMFKTLAYCIPEACHDLRTALAYKFQLQYNLEVTWQDAAVHCGDYQTSEWCFKTFNYYQEVERVTAEAQQLASRLGECLRRECGTYE